MSPQPRRRPQRADRARVAAWRLLRDVQERDSFANLALNQHLGGLDERDRAFATELAYGTLRTTGQLDHLIEATASRRASEIDAPLLDVVRLGVYQLLHTRVPGHAAVATSVELARAVTGEGSSRFANAILRRASDHIAASDDFATKVLAPPRSRDPIGWLSIVHAHPRWVVEALGDALDGDGVELERALAADNERPVTHLVARTLTSEDLLAAVADAGLEGHRGQLSPRSVILDGGDPGRIEPITVGAAAVQDEGSQLIALALAGVEAPAGITVDLCAGPGGKAALLASTVPGLMVAVEPRTARARLVRKSLESVSGFSVTVRADGRAAPIPRAVASRVLVDAPCTGLGALRRRPESRWRRDPSDLDGLVRLQEELLHEGADLLVPGGVLAYATCSPHLRETRDVVERLLADRRDLELSDAAAAMAKVTRDHTALADGPYVQLWTHKHGTDSMFLALLRRR